MLARDSFPLFDQLQENYSSMCKFNCILKSYNNNTFRDTSATAYYQSGNVLDVLVEVLGKRGRDSLQQGLSEMERMKAERFFKGTKVEVTYHSAIKRRFRVLGVSKEPVNQAKFYNG